MQLRLRLLSFTAASLLFSLGSPQIIMGKTLNTVASDSQAQATQELEAEAEGLSQKATQQWNRGQLLEAADTFEQALGIYRNLDYPQRKDATIRVKKIEILRNLVEIYTSLPDASKTREFSKGTLPNAQITPPKPSAQELGDRNTELKLLIALGDSYNSLGKYEQAVESATASLALAQELQNAHAKAAAFVTLATAYQSLASNKSEYQKAIKAAMSSLTTAWSIKDYDSEAKALAILGSIYSAISENQNAITYAQQGLKVAKENDIPTAAVSSLLTLAGIYLEQGEYPKAVDSSAQGIDYLQKLQKREAEGAASVMLGLAELGQGDFRQSLKLAEQGLAISQEVKAPLTEALAFIVLSLNYSDSGNIEKAIELLNQSRAIAKEQKNRDLEAVILEVFGGVYSKAGQKKQAIASYQESISISDSYSATVGLARAYQDSNRLGTAMAYYKQAINKNEEQAPRKIPGLPIWLQASFPQAIQDILGVPTAEVYRSLTNLLLLDRRIGEAQQVLELLKGQELREYTDDSSAAGQTISLTITPIEKQILKEYGSLISFGQRLDECQQTNCSQLEELLEQRQRLTDQYYQVLEQLETESRRHRNSDEAFVEPHHFAQKAQEIVESQPGTILIYPLVLGDKIWLLWASKGGIFKSVEVEGVSQSQLQVTVLKFRQLLQNRLSNIDEVRGTGKQLYDWLIKPLESELKANDIHNLVFSLDRSTRYIPMSALYDGENYLIENYSVSTVLSANLTPKRLPVDDPKQRVTTSPSASPSNREAVASLPASAPLPNTPQTQALALGLSNAVAGFKPLPNVPAELDAIVRQDTLDSQGIYPGQKFLNNSFDLFALRNNIAGHQVVHIATHSKFVPGPANKSYLLLGTGEKLAIPDIETWLNLQNVDLVVLSACETALGGPGLNGKEIAGIGYYFLKQGANTVLASLWNVDDQSTRLLMEQFYKNLAKGTPESAVTKAEALRQAQLVILRGEDTDDTADFQIPSSVPPVEVNTDSPSLDQEGESISPVSKKFFRHPYYWSAFILMGQGL